MFNLFQKSALGLDLSDLSLKVVQLKKTGKKLALAGFLRKPLPAGIIVNGEIKKEEELIQILKAALLEVKGEPIKIREVVCNLPEEKVFIRLVQLPKMKEKEIESAIKWEIEAHIPLPIEEVYLDWQIIKPLKNHLDHSDILIAATPKVLAESYLSVLKKAGLKPLALEPESVAVIRSLIKGKSMRPTIIIDLGTTGTNFVIFSAGAIRFTSHISVSGQSFNQAIMASLGVNEEKARELKIKIGLDKLIEAKADSNEISEERGRVYRALEPLLDDLAKQIQDYIDFYHDHASHTHGPDGAIAQVLLCGGDSLLANLDAFLSHKLNLEVKLGNPWINIYKEPPQEVLGLTYNKSLAYTTALGLALRNFMNHES